MKNLLITFGCSWTFGVGTYYKQGMTDKEYWSHPKVYKPHNTFRSIIAKELNADNLNFSIGASSNDKQLRYAKHFFASQQFVDLQDEYDKITVLWGITSTARIECWDYKHQDILNLFLLKSSRRYANNMSVHDGLSKTYLRYFYDLDHKVFELAKEMHFWNSYFDSLGITNYWFDTFNHHDYYKPHIASKHIGADNDLGHMYSLEDEKYTVDNDVIPNHVKLDSVQAPCKIHNLLFDDREYRDLCSILAIDAGLENIDNSYIYSALSSDGPTVDFLVSKGLLNPVSFHPTLEAHQSIASLMLKEINTL